MKLVFGLVALAAALFVVGGVGTIAGFVTHAGAVREAFMWIFLCGLLPTMIFLAISLGIGIYHMYLNRIAGKTPSGWFSSESKESGKGGYGD